MLYTLVFSGNKGVLTANGTISHYELRWTKPLNFFEGVTP